MSIVYEGSYDNLVYDDFPPVIGKPIIILRNYLFCRCHSKQEKVISSDPKFFRPLNVAISYSTEKNKKISCFTNTEEIRLIDIRYLRLILQPILSSCDPYKNEEIIAKTMLAIGIGSFNTQIKIAQRVFQGSHEQINNMIEFQNKLSSGLRYNGINPIEAHAFRIAETHLDSYVFLFLKEILGKYCDGIISPRLFSPFHIEKSDKIMTNEIFLFNPKKSGLVPVPDMSKIFISNHTIPSIIGLENKKQFKPYTNKEFFIQFGGDGDNEQNKLDRNSVFNDKKRMKEMKKQFKNISKDFEIYDFFPEETEKEKRSRLGIVPWCHEIPRNFIPF